MLTHKISDNPLRFFRHFSLTSCFAKSILVLSFLPNSSPAQASDSLNWFPRSVGDMWEYWVTDGVIPDTAQSFNIKDSVLADGRILLTQRHGFINPTMYEDFPVYTVDTANSQIIGPLPSDPLRSGPILRYKVQQGDQWVMYDYSAVGGPGYEMARVKEIYEGMLFGKAATYMNVNYFLAQDSTDTLGLDRTWDTYATGFGLVESFPAEGGYWYRLKGAVIDGILYGDTTYLITSVRKPLVDLPQIFELYQNYPNPFNPSTTIRFDLNIPGDVSLIIYDVWGREIRRAIDDQSYASGIHEIVWDGTTDFSQPAASGVYYYRLIIGSAGITRSMILIK